MQIMIDIPEKFENHFNSDRFEDSLQRVRFDIHKSIIGNKDVLSGNYEIETLDMLTEAFLNGTPLPKGHGKLKDIDKVEELLDLEQPNNMIAKSIKNIIDSVPAIIEADYAGLEEKHLGNSEDKTGIYTDDVDAPKTVNMNS